MGDTNEGKTGPLLVAHERSFARSKKRTNAGCRFVRSTSGIFLFFLAIENRQSKFGNSFGGIAQLVERQLCKLEVRGSNPLASSPESFRGCRAVAFGEGGRFIFDLRFAIADLSKCARSAPRNKIENRQSTFENLAAQPRCGPVAQLVRACA